MAKKLKMKKKDIVSIIQNTESFNNPKVELEQYCIDAACAVDIIYFAGFEFNDISDKLIVDLGAGTGRLSFCSAFLNAKTVVSVDVDFNALTTLKMNAITLGLETLICPICSDIRHFEVSRADLFKNYDITTIMNPPFGVQNKFADRAFLKKAFSFSDVVYSIHLAGEKNHQFISNYIKKFNWRIDNVLPFNMILENSFKFHTQKTKKIDVNVYRFVKKES